MAEEAVITFGADFSQVRRQLNDFASEVERMPMRARIVGDAASGYRARFPGGAMNPLERSYSGAWPGTPQYSAIQALGAGAALGMAVSPGMPAGAIGAAAGAAGGAGGISSAGASVAAALTSVAQQIRVAGGAVGMVGGPGGAGMLPFARGGTASPLILGGPGGGGGGMIVSGPAGGGAGNGAPIPVQVRRVAAAGGGGGLPPSFISIPGAAAGGGGGGGGNVPGSGPAPTTGGRRLPGEFTSFMAARRLLTAFGVMEGVQTKRAEMIGRAEAQYATSAEGILNAEMGIVGAASTGLAGTFVGLGTDIAGMAASAFGSSWRGVTGTRIAAIEARAMMQGSISSRRDIQGVFGVDRTIAGGIGQFGSRRAGIENNFLSQQEQISSEREDASNIQDDRLRQTRMSALRSRQAAAERMRDYELRQVNLDLGDARASAMFDKQVSEGSMTRGTATRLGMVRQWARMPVGGPDQQTMNAQIEAFDAAEGYRVWGREYGAGIDAQSAQDRYNRQPNVARARGIYGAGVMQSESARREGSGKEADLILQRTAYELMDLRRELVEGGSGVQITDPTKIDMGQAGASGLASVRPGDDTVEALKRIEDLLKRWLPPIGDGVGAE